MTFEETDLFVYLFAAKRREDGYRERERERERERDARGRKREGVIVYLL